MRYSKLISVLKPYTAGEQPKDKKYIKLNTNENAYPPSPAVKEAIGAVDYAELRLYPDPEATELCGALAQKHGVLSENIFTGNGSDEVLGFCFPAFFDRKEIGGVPVLFADVTYSFYPVYANLYQIPYEVVPLKEDYTVDIEDYAAKKNQGILLCNPNAPTGIAVPTEGIERLVKADRERLVLVDEAYADFGGVSAVPLTKKYDNLLVVRTFSKGASLAGIRCGYAVGAAGLIRALQTVKNSFNSYTLDKLTQKIAIAACKDTAYYDMINERISNIRDKASETLRKKGFTVLPSSSNFIFLKKDGIGGKELFLGLRERGVLVRYFAGARTGDFIRVTIGTEDETEIFIRTLCNLT
ncbi:MAG: histidinol-phosphate transaminase [Clostridiales bacterium]|jgi:histidinol-phosphate aminotransferase|nr:histidinol-phosphate transaminase [Clostridiales bacterium]